MVSNSNVDRWRGSATKPQPRGARSLAIFAGAAAAAAWPGPAAAQSAVTFDGAVVASCVLTLSTPGALATNANGTEIGSEQSLGTAAVLSVTATAGAPTVAFTAPTMASKPSGYSGTPVVMMKYTSTGGASQAYTNSSSNYTSSNALGDTITLDAKASDSSGFVAGSYRVQTTATCSQ